MKLSTIKGDHIRKQQIQQDQLQDMLKEINSPEAHQGFKAHELSKYTTQELKDELRAREQASDYHYGHNISILENPGYCSDCEVYFEF